MDAAGVFEPVDGFPEGTAGVPDGDGALEGESLAGAVRAGEGVRDVSGKRFAANFAGRLGDGFKQFFTGRTEVSTGGRRQPDNAGCTTRGIEQVQSRPGQGTQHAGEAGKGHGSEKRQRAADGIKKGILPEDLHFG